VGALHVRIGIALPQGYFGDYAGWTPTAAWDRTVAIAQSAERLGFDSIWLYDHLHTAPEPTDELTFESTTSVAALAAVTTRVRVGQLVLYSGFRRHPHVVAIAATMDALSRGRFELGLGAGWKAEEATAYGFRFPDAAGRLGVLDAQLRVMRERLPRVRIVVGGNGPQVTMRLAARYADELDLNLLTPVEVADALPIIRARCDEAGRDPGSLSVSVQLRGEVVGRPGSDRIARLAAYRELGLARVIVAIQSDLVAGDAALDVLAADARTAGVSLDA
jgi:alkanesulfonate monooxygenase SsuD/methylene tetrahydromethanopterin reductase-like flavin-dependent oxidoreductase (luciferase family)